MLSRRGVFYILRGFGYPEPETCSQKGLEPLGGQKALQWSGGRGTTPSRRLTINASRVPPRALGSHGSIHAKWRRALTLTRIQPVLASKGHFPNLHFNLGVHPNKTHHPHTFPIIAAPRCRLAISPYSDRGSTHGVEEGHAEARPQYVWPPLLLPPIRPRHVPC